MSRGKAKGTSDADDVKLQITSMIDVTFLLLIFFMLLPFRTLERKVAAFLPVGVGHQTDLKGLGHIRTIVSLMHHPLIATGLAQQD